MIISKLLYVLFILSIKNISTLLILFMLVPLMTLTQYFRVVSLIFAYLYLGVIILFIIIGIIILNIKMNLINPLISLTLLITYRVNNQVYIISIRFYCVITMFIILLMLIYIMSELFHC